MIPISNASANSWRVNAPRKNEPTTSIESTGSTEVIDVLIERISTWLRARFIISV